MFEDSILLKKVNFFKRVKIEIYIFITTLLFYSFLWIINPGNKFIAASFVFLIFIYYWRIKDFKLSVMLTYIASTVVFTGKKYLIDLIPPGIYPEDVFPQGNVLFFIITPGNIIIFLIFLLVIKDFLQSKLKAFKINLIDILIFCYFLWKPLSDLLGSVRPEVSLLFSLFGFSGFVFYIFLKNYFGNISVNKKIEFLSILVFLAASLLVFQSLISFQQFIISSPVYKNIESQVDIEYFGNVADEPQFRYRPVGTFNHANQLGIWLSFWLSVILVYISKKQNYFLFMTLIMGATALILTLSRSAWMGWGISLMFILFITEKVKKVKLPQVFHRHFITLTLISVILTLFFVFPRMEKSLYTFMEGGAYLRNLQIQDTIRLIIINPVFGVGTGMNVLAGLLSDPSGVFSYVALSVHNWYLLTAVEQGIPALIFFLSFLLIVLRKQIYVIFNRKMFTDLDFIRLGFVGGIFSLLAIGFFQPFIGEGLILLSFAILGDAKNGVVK